MSLNINGVPAFSADVSRFSRARRRLNRDMGPVYDAAIDVCHRHWLRAAVTGARFDPKIELISHVVS